MEVIIAAFEMQMGPCILRSKSSAVRLSVFWLYVCLCGIQWRCLLCFSLPPIVGAPAGDERDWHSGEMAVKAEDWSQVKERWQIPNIVSQNLSSVFCCFPVAHLLPSHMDLPLTTETELQFPSRSTCEGGREESQRVGSQKEDTGGAGNSGEALLLGFSHLSEQLCKKRNADEEMLFTGFFTELPSMKKGFWKSFYKCCRREK